MKNKVIKIIKYLILIIGLTICFLSIYIKNKFNDISFEQILNTLQKGEGTSFSAVKEGLIFVSIRVLIFLIIIIIIRNLLLKIKPIILKFKIKERIINIDLLKQTNLRDSILLMIFLISSILFAIKLLNINVFIKNQIITSNIFEEYYVILVM